MNDELPDWYPLANASDEEIDSWLAAATPPYEKMRDALPWLDQAYQFDAWVEEMRDARTCIGGSEWAKVFPGIASIPLLPRRLVGHTIR